MTFIRTTAINKLLKMKARKKVVQGGTYGGKTHGIIPIIANRLATKPRLKATVVCETIPAVKDGPVTIYKDVMEETGRFVEKRWISNPLQYTYANRSLMQFKSFDTVGKAKAAGKRDILFLNEANHIPYDIADVLITRSEEVWIDYNPDHEFWAHTEILKEPNSEFLCLTYEDNEACPASALEELTIKTNKAFYNPYGDWNDPKNIKSEYWANWCRVYIRGETGIMQGVIFTNWTKTASIPEDARLLGRGIDFGYTNDPAAIIDVYKWNDYRILDEVAYAKGMSNADIAKKINDKMITYCDSAEPKSIAELQAYGVNAQPVTKGTDSVKFGIQTMQQQKYLVTTRSVNLIKELRKYSWVKEKGTGEETNEPIDDFNHAIDAVRYHEMESIGIKRGSGRYDC